MRVTVTDRLLGKLKKKSYRASYVANEVRLSLAHQIRSLRLQRGWTQGELAQRMKTKQSVVSRLENPDYDKIGLKSVLDAAAAFDVAFVGRYCAFDEMMFRQRDVTDESFHVQSFDADRLAFHCTAPQEQKPTATSDTVEPIRIVGPHRYATAVSV